MSTPHPWLSSYAPNTPHEIDLDEFPSIVSVLEQAIHKFGARPAFSNFGKTLTYHEIDELSAAFANYLIHELGLKKGERVAIMLPNLLQYPIALFGVLRAGLTVVNTNPPPVATV